MVHYKSEEKALNIVKRILRYIKETTNATSCFGGSEFIIKYYVDSNFASDLDYKIKNKIYYKLFVHTYKKSYEFYFKTPNYCDSIYNRSKVHDSYASLQESYLD